MKVELLHYTPLWVASDAIRTCWASGDKSDTQFLREDWDYDGVLRFSTVPRDHGFDDYEMGEKDLALIERVGNKFKHASTLEHITYNFHISGISRALLQELARHRMASISVKSSRYTLKELKDNCYFTNSNQAEGTTYRWDEIEKYIVLTGNKAVDEASANALIDLKFILEEGISNDIAKYCMPEAYKTECAWSINLRSLQNFLSLRTDKAALWEIRKLAYAIADAIPEEHKYLITDYIKT